MTIDDKYRLAFDIIKRFNAENNKDVVISVSEGIKNERFFYELYEGNVVLFLTWEDNFIDGKRYIFVNNLWIDPSYRKANTLSRLRILKKYLFKGVHNFYWFNKEKEKMIYRR